MIQVRVRQHDRGDVRRLDRKLPPVTLPQLLEPLKEPSVDEHFGVARVEKVLGSGDRPRCAEKRQLDATHSALSLVPCPFPAPVYAKIPT